MHVDIDLVHRSEVFGRECARGAAAGGAECQPADNQAAKQRPPPHESHVPQDASSRRRCVALCPQALDRRIRQGPAVALRRVARRRWPATPTR